MSERGERRRRVRVKCRNCRTFQRAPPGKRPMEFNCKNCGEKIILKRRKKKNERMDERYLFISILFLMILLTYAFTHSDLERDRYYQPFIELEDTSIVEADEGEYVKIQGVIECEETPVISGNGDPYYWEGELRDFYLNDSKDRILVTYKGGNLEPEIHVFQEPHYIGLYYEYHPGDEACVMGKLKNESGEPTIYLEVISQDPDGFYDTGGALGTLLAMSFFNSLLISVIMFFFREKKRTESEGKKDKLEAIREKMEKLQERLEGGSEWIDIFERRSRVLRAGAPGFGVYAPFTFIFFLYTFVPIYLLVPAVSFFFYIMFMGLRNHYQKRSLEGEYKKLDTGSYTGEDFFPVTLVFDVLVKENLDYSYSDREIDYNQLYYSLFDTMSKKHYVHLPDYDMTIRISTSMSEGSEHFSASLLVGPVTEKNHVLFDRLGGLLKEEVVPRAKFTCPSCEQVQSIKKKDTHKDFTCRHCGQKLKEESKGSGVTRIVSIINCSGCDRPFKLPDPDNLPLDIKCPHCGIMCKVLDEPVVTRVKLDKEPEIKPVKIMCPRCDKIQVVTSQVRPLDFACKNCGQLLVIKVK
jgi:ribosomal protein S27E